MKRPHEEINEHIFGLLLEYEIAGSWWAWLVPYDFAAQVIARRTMRKYRRYMKFKSLTETTL